MIKKDYEYHVIASALLQSVATKRIKRIAMRMK